MCVQYWPAGKMREEVYSGIGVTVENEEQLANFMIRTIRMRKVRITGCNKKNGPPSRSIYSLLNHFTTFFYNFDNHSVLPPYTKKLSLDYFYQKFQNCLGKQSKKVSYFGQGVHFFCYTL